MRIAIIGAGIAGITTAYELARDGHEVTVIERDDAVAAQSSFANAGLISPALLSWPGRPGRTASWFSAQAAGGDQLAWRPRWQRDEWRWLRLHRRSRSLKGESARRALLQLGALSRERLQQLSREHRLSHERSQGLLVLRRSASAHARADAARWTELESLTQAGIQVDAVDGAGCRQIEPGLNPATSLADGLHLPESQVGNCREFAHQLRLVCQREGQVRFHFQTQVTALQTGTAPGPRLKLAPASGDDAGRTARGRQPAEQVAFLPTQADPPPPELCVDAVVLCTGTQRQLATAAGMNLPLLPVWGLGVTFRLRDDLQEQALRSAVIEADTGLVLSRLGQRLRVCGGWVLGGAASVAGDAYDPLYAALDRWFPLAAQRAGAQLWRGARPMLPDGLPVIGPATAGVWLQLGHAGLGWMNACAAARLLADQIAGRSCAIDPAPFSAHRWITP